MPYYEEVFTATITGSIPTAGAVNTNTSLVALDLQKLIPPHLRNRKFRLSSSFKMDLGNSILNASNFIISADGFTGNFKNYFNQNTNLRSSECVLGVSTGFANTDGVTTNYQTCYDFHSCNETDIDYPNISYITLRFTEVSGHNFNNVNNYYTLSLKFQLCSEKK